MWVDELDHGVRSKLSMIALDLELPSLYEYQNQEHFLADVYRKTRDCRALAYRAEKALGPPVVRAPWKRAK